MSTRTGGWHWSASGTAVVHRRLGPWKVTVTERGWEAACPGGCRDRASLGTMGRGALVGCFPLRFLHVPVSSSLGPISVHPCPAGQHPCPGGSALGLVALAQMQAWLSWFLDGLSSNCPVRRGTRCLRTVGWVVALCLWVFLFLLTLCGSCFEWVWWTGLHGCDLNSCSF